MIKTKDEELFQEFREKMGFKRRNNQGLSEIESLDQYNLTNGKGK